MSNIPEVTLQTAIVKGLRSLRENPRILDSIFRDQTQAEQTQIKNFFLNKSIDFSMNYPRGEELKVPAIILTMMSDTESDPVIGDFLGMGAPQDMLADTLGSSGASISTRSNLNTKLIGNIQVEYTETDDITGRGVLYWNRTFTPEIIKAVANAPSASYTVFVTNGYGAGQKHVIKQITNNSLDIRGTFDPQLNTTSVIAIRRTEEQEHSDGQPSRSYQEDENNLVLKGSIHEARYKINILGGSSAEVIFLYSALKTILLSQRVYLEDQGLQGLTMQGTEFSPQGDYLPNIVYGRAMTISFKYVFSFVEELPIYSAIEVTVLSKHAPFDPACAEFSFEVTI